MLRHSQREQLKESDSFIWATGIEDTFITAPWPKTGRTLDEYELTGHYECWREDLDLMSELDVRVARYGIPWHRTQPTPNKWDWSFADKTLERLLELGIEPIVDLVHYGLPAWINDAYLHPDFPKYMADYAGRLAQRFKGRIHAYTPLNEPRITAWYCGKLGWWPPFRRGWSGFVQVMIGVCRGIVQTVEALREVDPEILCVHVDATDLYEGDGSLDTPSARSISRSSIRKQNLCVPLLDEVQRRQEIVFLALDLISGRVNEQHKLTPWLVKLGVGYEDLLWFREHAVELPLIGINLYPMFSRKILTRSRRRLRIRMPYSTAEIIDRLAELYWQRYQSPLIISETASVGSVKRRREWLDSSVAAVRRVRARGIPLVGYTWWPMFALVTWACRQGEHPPAYYLKQMGLWDIDPDLSANLRRVRTPLVDAYREHVGRGCESVGALKQTKQQKRRAHVS